MKFLGFGKEKLPSVVKDPFSIKKIKQISVTFYSDGGLSGNRPPWASGWIEFKNGDTEGKLKFNGDTFDEVVLQIKAALESL